MSERDDSDRPATRNDIIYAVAVLVIVMRGHSTYGGAERPALITHRLNAREANQVHLWSLLRAGCCHGSVIVERAGEF